MKKSREMRLLLAAIVASSILLLAASPALQFRQPAAGAHRTFMPQRIELDFDAAADAASLEVVLNGNDVTSLFSLGAALAGRRSAIADDVFDELLLGANELDASIELGGSPETSARDFFTTGDPYADAVVLYTPGASGGFNSGALPGVVLGAPAGEGLFLGSLDVLSLGFGGSVVLEFSDNVIVDYTGVDFTVFENAILEIGAGSITGPPFAEPGRVSVSQDGTTWFDFPCSLSLGAGPYWPGCAGVYPVLSDGTSFTPHASIPTQVPIEDLVGVSLLSLQTPGGAGGNSYDLADVGLDWARFVKIEAADFATGPIGVDNAAFDLDALAAVHSAPAIPSLPGLSLPALSALAAAVAAFGARLSAGRGQRR